MRNTRRLLRSGGRLTHHYGRFVKHTRGKKCPCFKKQRKTNRRH